jgi:hypothetical protein
MKDGCLRIRQQPGDHRSSGLMTPIFTSIQLLFNNLTSCLSDILFRPGGETGPALHLVEDDSPDLQVTFDNPYPLYVDRAFGCFIRLNSINGHGD